MVRQDSRGWPKSCGRQPRKPLSFCL